MSRLVDLCRQSIVFENMEGIARCLQEIRLDPDAVVVRVKNRYDPKLDSALSAGYRDVSLNLRLRQPLTRELGIDAHVCEVQLILRAFAELKVRVSSPCSRRARTHIRARAARRPPAKLGSSCTRQA